MHAKSPKPLRTGGVRKIAADLRISLRYGDQAFTLNCVRMLDGKFAVKRGHDLSEKMPMATLTEIFTAARKWAAQQ
jgi:hypothetical protein